MRIFISIVFYICFVLLIWQTCENIAIYLKHPTAHSSSSKHLIQATFPKIEICLNSGFDWDYITSHGYKSMGEFARGTLENETFHG